MPLSSHYLLTIFSLSSHYHLTIISLSSHYHLTIISLSSHYHLIIISSSSLYIIIIIIIIISSSHHRLTQFEPIKNHINHINQHYSILFNIIQYYSQQSPFISLLSRPHPLSSHHLRIFS